MASHRKAALTADRSFRHQRPLYLAVAVCVLPCALSFAACTLPRPPTPEGMEPSFREPGSTSPPLSPSKDPGGTLPLSSSPLRFDSSLDAHFVPSTVVSRSAVVVPLEGETPAAAVAAETVAWTAAGTATASSGATVAAATSPAAVAGLRASGTGAASGEAGSAPGSGAIVGAATSSSPSGVSTGGLAEPVCAAPATRSAGAPSWSDGDLERYERLISEAEKFGDTW